MGSRMGLVVAAAWALVCTAGGVAGCAAGCDEESDEREAAADSTAQREQRSPVSRAEAEPPEPLPWPDQPGLALGAAHSCRASIRGHVRCWGSNRFGQLGRTDLPNGPEANRSEPVAVESLDGVVALAAGAFHTCGLRRDRRVLCWGHGGYGLLGEGRAGGADVPAPRLLAAVEGAVEIAAGEGFTCARTGAGRVVCWGRNDHGQLARDEGGAAAPAEPVEGIEDAEAIAAGRHHACALGAGGTVWCWGLAVDGQTGADPGVDAVRVPHRVPIEGEPVELAAGGYHTCVRMDDGEVRCWGANDSGQLGDGEGGNPEARRTEPAPMTGIDSAEGLALGARFSCLRTAGGGVACAGYNGSGQLGDGTTRRRGEPAPIEGLEEVTRLAAGAGHACAVVGGEHVRCWGKNDSGQLGDGTTEDAHEPTDMVRQQPADERTE